MANALLSLRLAEDREQGGKEAGVTDHVWGQTKNDREQARTSRAQATWEKTASVPGRLPLPAHLTGQPENGSA